LPVEKFFDHNNGNLEVKDDFGKLPYPQIDLIFNHKNVFANLQNPNPQKIYYHIHDKT
jgi:centrosomal protein CEP76